MKKSIETNRRLIGGESSLSRGTIFAWFVSLNRNGNVDLLLTLFEIRPFHTEYLWWLFSGTFHEQMHKLFLNSQTFCCFVAFWSLETLINNIAINSNYCWHERFSTCDSRNKKHPRIINDTINSFLEMRHQLLLSLHKLQRDFYRWFFSLHTSNTIRYDIYMKWHTLPRPMSTTN